MRICLPIAAFCALFTVSCSQPQTTCITDMADLPLKTTTLPSEGWKNAPMRANAQFMMYGANTEEERELRKGDFYFLRWYDAEPQKPVRVEMLYTQALTGADVLTRTVEYNEPREKAGMRREEFHFSGEDRAKRGDVMTWKVNLYCDGKIVDTLQSYLWE
ncbi:MAG: hypothetical protein IJ956_08570 [Akkermansia sp.]|nr:hypothetical protein [Akkermansia sp.]